MLAVGGIREKVIAARRGKVMEVILPEANRKDFEELPVHIRKGMTAHFVKAYPEVAAIAFESVSLFCCLLNRIGQTVKS